MKTIPSTIKEKNIHLILLPSTLVHDFLYSLYLQIAMDKIIIYMPKTINPIAPKTKVPNIAPTNPKLTTIIHASNPKTYPITHKIIVLTTTKKRFRVNSMKINETTTKYIEHIKKKLKYPLSFFKKPSKYPLIKLSQEMSDIYAAQVKIPVIKDIKNSIKKTSK